MAELQLIPHAQSGDTTRLIKALDSGAEIHESDNHGWTALNWAAGKGHLNAVALLLERGADVARSGPDGRTPYMIAKAAGHDGVAGLLEQAEKDRGLWKDPRSERLYCRAYQYRALLEFAGFSEVARKDGARPEHDFVFVHQDLTVTASMWHGENVIVESITPEWQQFCESTLGFRIPD